MMKLKLKFPLPRFIIFKSSLRAVLNNKFRIFLSSLGVMIGITPICILLSFSYGIQNLIGSQLGDFFNDKILMYVGAMQFTKEDIAYVNNHKDQFGIKEMSFATPSYNQIKGIVGITLDAQTMMDSNAQVLSSDANYIQTSGAKLIEGSLINEFHISKQMKVAVVSSGLLEKFFGKQNPIGYTLQIGNDFYQIIGVVEQKTAPLNTIIYIPMSNSTTVSPSDKFQVVIVASDPNKTENVQADLVSYIYMNHRSLAGLMSPYFVNPKQIIKIMDNFNLGLTALILAIGSVSLFISGLGIMNTMLASVGERTNEIGLRKALGATDFRILMQMLLESTMIVAFGSYAGSVIALAIIYPANIMLQYFNPKYWNETLYKFQLAFDFRVLFIIIVITAIVGIISGIYPAIKASRLSPIEALKQT